ncbi:MAG: YaiO family outer membrane beta-barrel protein, partial [bacterium]
MINFKVSFSYKRQEYLVSYDRLNPFNSYGEYKTFSYNFYNQLSNDKTYFFSFSVFNRKIEKDGVMGSFGIYKDWNPNLYTYSSISISTNTIYLPKYRIDHEFYLKTLKSKNLVLNLGGSYIKYFNNSNNTIFSLGLIYYGNGFNFTYKYLINNSDPGNIISYTNIYSLGLGYEKKSWLYLNYNVGNQSYLATYLPNPILVNNKAKYYSINYRKWLNNNSGFIIEYNYLDLKNSYTKNGFIFGFFKEYIDGLSWRKNER